ncbi:MAG: hypothetical protein ABSG78_04865 [Verrucomicrobiota bacterium]
MRTNRCRRDGAQSNRDLPAWQLPGLCNPPPPEKFGTSRLVNPDGKAP